jgi:conjugative transfer signal peptidase TraF
MMRIGAMVAAFAATMAMGVSVIVRPAPELIWNASASVPVGLYRVWPVGALQLGDLVVVTPPEPLAGFLAKRGYLPKGVPLLKRVLALPGQLVCRVGRTITVDGITVGEARDRDRRSRTLPVWQGCRVLAEGEVFLMNRQSADSFDGRYFGPLAAASIVGRADPLWTGGRE